MVRVTSRPIAACGGQALVTVDVEPAAQRGVTVAEGFIVGDTVDGEWAAELTDGAVAGVLAALDECEDRAGPLCVVLVRHVVHPVDSGYGSIRGATARAVRDAIAQLAEL